ncbi:MAG: sensor histidine kinase [Dactylosporangium sp.]|nr:sensor histidine kinase [Dactylosporangium sp.]NNJ62765.1 sensor histidine kinase [Dactylosporangium sp.]
MTPEPAAAQHTTEEPPRTTGPALFARLGDYSLYVMTGMPIALASFVIVVTGASLGAGLVPMGIGPVILTGVLMLARGFADLERSRIRKVLDMPIARPAYRRPPSHLGWWRRQILLLGDSQAWLDVAHSLVQLPVTLMTWTIGIFWWGMVIAGVGRFTYDWANPKDNTDIPELLGLGDGSTIRIGVYTLIGLGFLITLPPVLRWCAMTQARSSKALLSGLAELKTKISGLEAGVVAAQEQTATAQARTVAAVSAEASALRRLERDIHDGPQQRLVRLAMDLGRAQHQLDSADTDAARQTVAEAMGQTRETLDELRALSRGIAPPILIDRGLTAALTALAGRCTVPVELSADELGRLRSSVESTAYFVVAEALTNIAKHSAATECQIHLQQLEESMIVTVSDNGVGGASTAKGHGLAGLHDRVQALGGRLIIASAADQGTVVTAVLPLR